MGRWWIVERESEERCFYTRASTAISRLPVDPHSMMASFRLYYAGKFETGYNRVYSNLSQQRKSYIQKHNFIALNYVIQAYKYFMLLPARGFMSASSFSMASLIRLLVEPAWEVSNLGENEPFHPNHYSPSPSIYFWKTLMNNHTSEMIKLFQKKVNIRPPFCRVIYTQRNTSFSTVSSKSR